MSMCETDEQTDRGSADRAVHNATGGLHKTYEFVIITF